MKKRFSQAMAMAGHAVIIAAFLPLVISVAPAQIVSYEELLTEDKAHADTGLRLGSFIFRPVLRVNTAYDDNILRTKSNKISDNITNVMPSLLLQSGWGRHAIGIAAEGDFGSYASNSDRDYADYKIAVAAKYDIASETWLTFGAARVRRHENRGLSTVVTGDRPIFYTANTAQAGFTRALSYIKLKIFGEAEDVSLSSDASLLLPGNYQKRNTQNVETTLSYDYMPGNGVFVSALSGTTEYSLLGGADQRSNGTNIRAGFNFDSGVIWRGSVYTGYIFRTYSTGTADTKNPYFGGSLTWSPSDLTSISAVFDQTFNTTTVAGAAGVVQTTRRLSTSHAFTRKFSLDWLAGMNSNDYVGGSGAVNRDTDVYYAGTGAEYAVSDTVGLRLGYDIQRRKSDQAADEYTNNRIVLSVTFRK